MPDPFIGQIMQFGGNFAPRGWALCDGALLAISSNQALFSILGTTYGGDGRTTFGLPDLRGRAAVHPGSGPGLTTRRLGEKSGTETVTLSTAQMPSHLHHSGTIEASIRASTQTAGSSTPDANAVLGHSGSNIYTDHPPDTNIKNADVSGDTSNTGGGQSHNNMQPYGCVNFIIALIGVFPSRN